MLLVTALIVLAMQHANSQELGEMYNVTIQQGAPATLKYTVDTRNGTLKTIRVTVTSPNASVANPVLVSVNQLYGVTSWQIPFVDQDISYYEVGHTLCPTLNSPLDELAASFNVTVAIYTFSTAPVTVYTEANAIENFILKLDEPITVGVTSSSPVYYAFNFTSDVERVLIKVRSSGDSEEICAVASTQIASCPSDGVNSQLFSTDGSFQSMRSLAAITTDKPDTQTFFYLVIAVFESSSDCRVSDSRGGLKDTSLTDKINFLSIQLNRTVRSHGPVKNVTIMIEETLTSYAAPIIVPFVFFIVVFYGGAFIGVILFDYALYFGHWIHPLTKRDDIDQPGGDDLERGSNHNQSFRFKRRPSLMKVLAGTYLNDIMSKEVLSQSLNASTPPAGGPRSNRIQLASQNPRTGSRKSRKGSDSDVFTHNDEAYSPLTQSLPAGYRYRANSKVSTTSSVVSGNVITPEHRLTSSSGQVSSPLSVTAMADPSVEQTGENYSKQPSTESGEVQIHKEAARELNQTQLPSESSTAGDIIELKPHFSPRPHTATTTAAAVACIPPDQPFTESVRVQIHKDAAKELQPIPESNEEVAVEMQSVSPPKSHIPPPNLFPPTSPSIASSEIGVPSPELLSPTSPPFADKMVQANISAVGQKRTAKQWLVKTLADVHVCEGEEEQIRYRRYCWYLFIISIFYALPAFQLILTYQQLLNITGNQDICYYNYLCSHKLGELSAFNNVWSNIGYVALGFLFILLAARRQVKYHAIEEYNRNLDDPSCRTGVPQHFGIYYTIGFALVAEGFLSAFYHVCPNDTNFQFDTAFMFIIAGLGIYQIFHNRHPEFTANAHILYFSFALLIIVAFCGALFPSAGFWIVMIILYLVWTVFVSFQFYYHGVIKCDIRCSVNCANFPVVKELLCMNYQQFPSKPYNTEKFVYVILLYFANLILATYGLVSYFTSPMNFNSFVLTVMIANLTLYLFYYVIVKCICQENNCHRQHHPPKLFVYLSIAILCWIPAIVYFSQAETDWTVSPARSRDGNEDCQLMGFFNSHDIWHFLSSIALFFTLLMLMSLDDNREHIPRKDIRVF